MKEYVFLEMYPFRGNPVWIQGNKELTFEELCQMRNEARYTIDLAKYGFEIELGGTFVGQYIAVKCDEVRAKEILKKLNEGADPIEMMFEPKRK